MRKYTFQNEYFFGTNTCISPFLGNWVEQYLRVQWAETKQLDNKSVHCIQGNNETGRSLGNNRQKMRGSWEPGQLSQREWVDFLCLGGITKTTFLGRSVGLGDCAVSQSILYAVVWWRTIRESCRALEWGNLSGWLWERNWLTTLNPRRCN